MADMNQEPGWLYRQRDLVLGPVAAKQIIDKLYSGELGASTEVQLMGSGAFRPASEVSEFKLHLAKAAAKQRVDAQAAAHRASQQKKLIRVVAALVLLLGVIGAGVAAMGSYLAVHPIAGKSSEELAWGDITVDAPTIGRAKRTLDDDLVVYNDSRGPRRPPAAARMGEVDEVGINAVVSRHKPTLIPCIRQVAKAGVVAKIPIEFAISDSGRVTKVWVDNPDFKDSGLTECLLRELQKWPFKPGSSGASVNLSFNVGKRG